MGRFAPSLGGNSTKQKIIEIISLDWPLSAKKTYNILKREHCLNISYQATYKAITELVRDKILRRDGKEYIINKEWANSLEEFANKLKNDLDSLNYKKEVKSISKFVFRNYGEFVDFFVRFTEHVIEIDGKADVIFHYRHVPHIFVLSESRLRIIKGLMPKIKWAILSKNRGPVEEWNARQWRKFGVKVELGANISADSLIIINDHIIEIHTPKESLKKWDERTKSLKDYEIRPSLDEKKRKRAVVTILQDKELAETLRKQF